MNHWCLSILLFFLSTALAVGQTSDELKKKQQQLANDIAYKEKIIKKLEEDSKNTLSRLKLADQKIQQREELIGTLVQELDLINDKIAENQDLVAALESDIEALKTEYAKMITQAYKTRNTADKVMYIFASDDFEQAYRRMKYLQQLAEYRQRQAEAILSAQASLESKRLALEAQREEKNRVLNSHNQEKVVLSKEKQEKAKELSALSSQELKYKKELQEANKKSEEMRLAIKKAIEREILESNSGTASAPTKVIKLTPEALELGNSFVANKGKLPWPVDKGEIIGLFGEQPHPFLSGIIVKNNGINISTTEGSRARAVFDGEVTRIIIMAGAGKIVMVRHGEYITVYTNMKETFVKAGDKVKTKEELGVLLTDKGKTEFEFQLWKGVELQNPTQWIYKAR